MVTAWRAHAIAAGSAPALTCSASAAPTTFVLATHSPALLAFPGARIYELTAAGIAECAYDDVDAVRLTRGFLEAPDRVLRAALEAE